MNFFINKSTKYLKKYYFWSFKYNMNQILCTSNSDLEILKKNYKKKNLYISFLVISIIIAFILSLYYLLFRYDLYKSEKLSKKLLESFNITGIYAGNDDYLANRSSINFSAVDFDDFPCSVIGIIEIEKLNIIYPILSEINKNYLKLSPCKFYGPSINTTGNVCIAAHNYKNDSFFSKISDLSNGDIITIYDVSGNYIDYVVFNKYTASADDLSCISQFTNGLKIITLVTCDSLNNHYRTIVQAKEI